MTICTRCEGTGFLNAEQIPDSVNADDIDEAVKWLDQSNRDTHDVSICDCCGDGEQMWYGEPGHHYGSEDPPGHNGPYAYNGGLCECH